MTTTNTTDINIREAADRVIALLEQNRAREAMQLLAREREGERTVVQEALDRYVAAGARSQLAALQHPGAAPQGEGAFINTELERLRAAYGAPRFPVVEVDAAGERRADRVDELRGLTPSQRYDVYASVIEVHGSQAAQDALNTSDRVILGLRQENSTLASMDDPATTRVDESLSHSGKGVYDDRLVVLWKDANGRGHVYEALRANTEPTAQYDHHAGSTGRRPYAHGGTDTRVRAASPGFEDVSRPGKIEGDDVNGDGVRDLGRMAEGTYEMEGTTHAWPGRPGVMSFALRPSATAVRDGQLQIERDSNADGLFNDADVNGRQALNNSFKIHLGSRANTDSAGCQTVHSGDAEEFIAATRGTPGQTRWQYVLTSTSPGAARGLDAAVEHAPERRPPEQMPHRHQPPAHDHQPALQPRAGDAHGERFPPGRADAALFEAIHRQLPAGTSEAQAAHVMAQAKQSGIGETHQLDKVAVVDGNAWVVGRTPGFLAKVDLSAPVPPLAESLRQSEQLDQQQTAQGLERQRSMGARGMA